MKKNLFDISITAKIAISTALIMLLNVGLVILIAFFIQSEVAIGVSAKDLNDVVDKVVSEIRIKDSVITYGEDFKFVENNVYFLVLEEDGMVVAGRYPVNSGVEIGPPHHDFRKKTISSGDYYVYDAKIPGSSKKNPLWVRGIESVASADNIAHFLFMLIKILAPIFVIISGITSYFLAKNSLKPLNTILATVDTISDTSDLSGRINLNKGNDEIHRLAESFDNMFERLEAALLREKYFTSNISHELRTPLSVIKAQCDYLNSYGDDLEEYKEGVEVIQTQAQKMSDIAETLLSLTRLEQMSYDADNKTKNFDFENFFLDSLITEAIESAKNIYSEIVINFKTNVNSCEFYGNKQLLSICLLNLFSNVHKYGNDYANLVLEQNEASIAITITDSGDGLSPEDLPHIFNPFYRGNKNNRSTDGTGLGLSLVKRIIEAHNGCISASSSKDGTSFEITFPKNI